MRNVANELSQEFMRNIMDLPSSESEDENPLDLERYLLDGRGWMLLYAIHIIGVKVGQLFVLMSSRVVV